MKNLILLLVLFVGLFLTNCSTTKPTAPDVTTTPEVKNPPEPEKKYLSKPGCAKWDDFPYSEKEQLANNYVIYRNRLKNKDIEGAYELWQMVYAKAPAADGLRKTVFLDGVEFNIGFYNNTQDSIKQKEYVNTIKRLYQEAMDCYGDEGYFNGLLGFDLYYNFPNHATDLEKYTYLKKSIEIDGEKTSAFVINPFTALMLELYLKKEIPEAEAQLMAQLIPNIIENGLKGDEAESYKIVASYTPARLQELEGVKGFYDSEYYRKKYLGVFDRNPSNCDSIMMTFSLFNWAGMPQTDPDFVRISQAYATNCSTTDPNPKNSAARDGYIALKEGRYRDAVKSFDQAISEETESDKKAKYALINAKIYFSYLKKFYKSRSYARQALKHKPNMGAAYMLIGRLYASSGPICGPGTGWDSQIVTWPAIDKWKKAKSVDPSVAAEANKLINRYRKFMPSKEDIFQRGLKDGQSFHIPCWIKEKTIIRAAN